MPRSYEFYPGVKEELEEQPVSLPYSDEDLLAAVVNPKVSQALHETSPVIWFRSAIAFGSGRKPSEVSESEILNEILNGAIDDWHPGITEPIRDNLRDQGFHIYN